MNKIRLLLLIFLIASLSGCTPKGCSFLPRGSLLILSHHLEKSVDDEGELTAQITGVARNTSAAELQYAEVIGKFYSQDGTVLATGVAKTADLDPGQTWEFTISYPTEREAHSSLNILSWNLHIDSSGAWVSGEAENNGDVILSFAKVTATFYDVGGTGLGSGTATTTGLGVGEIWKYTIYYPARDPEDVGYVDYAKVEVTETDYELVSTQEVVRATVNVGALRGRSVMP
jgi:hypothetical protein